MANLWHVTHPAHDMPLLMKVPRLSWAYIAPEQVQFIRNDPRSDILGLGVMLSPFTTGKLPFGEPRLRRDIRRRLHVDPVPPRALRPDCLPWLQELLLKCLEVRPERRWPIAAQLARSTIIMAAVDIEQAAASLLEKLGETVRRIAVTEPGARMPCVSVLRTARIGIDDYTDDKGRNLHVKQLAALKHWARPISKSLKLDEGRPTLHVLESSEPAAALVQFGQRNRVAHIVMGPRVNSAVRRYLGSVSSQLVAQAECTVTVVSA